MQCICGPFFKIYLCFSRDFVNHHFFFATRITLRQLKTPVLSSQSLCLSRDSLSCNTRLLDLCISSKFFILISGHQEFFFPSNLVGRIFFFPSKCSAGYFFPPRFSAGFFFPQKRVLCLHIQNVFTFTFWPLQ